MENPLYAKIFKWISWALLIASVVLAVWAFTQFGGEKKGTAVEMMLFWAYAMLAIALIAVLCIGLIVSATTNPKSLIRIGVALVCAAGLCVVAYLLASGKQPLGFTGTKPPTDGELKLTDTVLNLTYILGGGAIVAIIAGEIISGILNKKA